MIVSIGKVKIPGIISDLVGRMDSSVIELLWNDRVSTAVWLFQREQRKIDYFQKIPFGYDHYGTGMNDLFLVVISK